ncbi:POT family-domain-containing protein [Chytriomyces sp. MP71]|nr:POT family-domain-containing protein [Chytriomyces sp. MP71]
MSDDKKVEADETGISELEDCTGLTDDQIRLRKLELEINKDRDAKILENPNKLPVAVWFIIPNELGERFCFYGISPIVKNFFKYQLGFHIPADANALKDAWSGLCYFTPIIGAIISDSYLDKFKTIVSLSTIYLLGLIILTITSWPTIMGVATTQLSRVGPFIGLVLIAFGTGGIKPCVSAHGGDQFLSMQKYGLQAFYNYFYMAINVGALISSIISPLIKQNEYFPWPDTGNKTLKQYFDGLKPDQGNGYPYSFLMMTCFFFLAMVIFVAGFKTYRVVPPAGKFILFDHMKVAGAYIRNRMKMSNEEAYKATCDVYTEGLVVEMLDLGKVIGAIWPAPIFWMAFGQNSGVWQDMGDQMKVPLGGTSGFFGSEITNNFWNPLFICLFAPLLANFVYPVMDRKFGEKAFGLQQRMVLGQLLAALAFVISALMQGTVNRNCYDGGDADSCASNVSILWEIVLYAVITLGECLFSISGLNFTYIEVGKRTKSSCAAIWLVLSGVGNFISSALLKATMAVDQNRVSNGEVTYDKITWNRTNFMWLLAGLCAGSAAIQAFIAYRYVPKAQRKTAHI